MTRCWWFGVLIGWGCLLAGPREDVVALLKQQEAAWNRGDLRAFMAAYEESEELTFVGKEVARGWKATLERYQRTYPTRAAMGTLTFGAVEVHEVGPGVVWVYGEYALARTAEGGGAAKGRFTLVVRQGKGGWRIVMDHTSS